MEKITKFEKRESSIKIVTNTPEKVTFEKGDTKELWFNHDCSDQNLLKQCGREGDVIDHIQWEDGEHLASLLHVYFKNKNKIESLGNESSLSKVGVESLKNQDFVNKERFILHQRDEVGLLSADKLYEVFKKRNFFPNDETRKEMAQRYGGRDGIVDSIEDKYKFDYFFFKDSRSKPGVEILASMPYEAVAFIGKTEDLEQKGTENDGTLVFGNKSN